MYKIFAGTEDITRKTFVAFYLGKEKKTFKQN